MERWIITLFAQTLAAGATGAEQTESERIRLRAAIEQSSKCTTAS
jgi:hypothetical protein